VPPETFKLIHAKLPQEEFAALAQTKYAMPSWMLEAFRQFEQSELTHD